MAWHALWTDTDPVAFLLDQVDIAIKTFGCNAVRVIGSHAAAAELGMPAYNALWSEFIEGCAELGAYVYPCMGYLDDPFGSLPTATLEAQAASWGAEVGSHFNVIGIDVTNEWRGGAFAAGLTAGAAWVTVQALATTLRTVTDKPLAISDFLSESVIAADYTWIEYAAGVFDWIDLHVYYDSGAPTASDLDHLLAAGWYDDFPIILGEFGIIASQGAPARTAYYEGVRDLRAAAGGVGAFAWAIKNDAYGLVNESGVTQSDIATPFLTFPNT